MSETEHASSTQIEALNEKQPEVVERKVADIGDPAEPRNDAAEGHDRRTEEDIREEAARHHAALTRDEPPHPTDIAHAVVFILGLMTDEA